MGKRTTDPAEIEYLNGKHFTATLTAGGNAKFVANAVSGLNNAGTETCTVTISYANSEWTFTASVYSLVGIHVESTNINATTLDVSTAGSVSVTAVGKLAT